MNPYELPPGYDAATLDPFYNPSMGYHNQSVGHLRTAHAESDTLT